MKATELRIGITVYRTLEETHDRVVTWEDIKNCMEHPENYSGIALTEEWLVKLGFSMGASESMSAYYHKKVGHDDFCIRIYRQHESPGFYFCMGNECNSSYAAKHYVHQLQNLYYALTGTELEIK